MDFLTLIKARGDHVERQETSTFSKREERRRGVLWRLLPAWLLLFNV